MTAPAGRGLHMEGTSMSEIIPRELSTLINLSRQRERFAKTVRETQAGKKHCAASSALRMDHVPSPLAPGLATFCVRRASPNPTGRCTK
jgi:hypothetical protein